jgi:hypothetical protein
MKYVFKPEGFEEGCRLWKELILDRAAHAEGMVRMQFFKAAPSALAVGTWKKKAYAEAFMQTGVFRELKQKIAYLLAEEPQSGHWELAEYCEGPGAE